MKVWTALLVVHVLGTQTLHPAPVPERAAVEATVAALSRSLRQRGSRPTESGRPLPHGIVRFAIAEHARTRDPELRKLLEQVVDEFGRGPLQDHLAGGFHRGPIRARAEDSHFEKLLGDNALLIRCVAQTHAAGGGLFPRRLAEANAAWAIREMRDSSGAFWSAVGSSGDPRSAAYYAWSRDEIVGVLGAGRAAEFFQVYGLEPPGMLTLRGSPFAGLHSSREALLNRRARRVRPPTDEALRADWNGLMIGALATAGRSLGHGSYVEAARRAATALLGVLGGPGRLKHSTRGIQSDGAATLEDYAFLAEGLLDLYEVTGEADWRRHAAALVDAATGRLWDVARGGFFQAEARRPLSRSVKSAVDSELPSGNAVMVSVLLRLARSTGERRYATLADRTVAAFTGDLQQEPAAHAALTAAAVEWLQPWRRSLATRSAHGRCATAVRAFEQDPGRAVWEDLQRLEELDHSRLIVH